MRYNILSLRLQGIISYIDSLFIPENKLLEFRILALQNKAKVFLA